MFPCIAGIDLSPCCVDIHGIVLTHVETVCLLSRIIREECMSSGTINLLQGLFASAGGKGRGGDGLRRVLYILRIATRADVGGGPSSTGRPVLNVLRV